MGEFISSLSILGYIGIYVSAAYWRRVSNCSCFIINCLLTVSRVIYLVPRYTCPVWHSGSLRNSAPAKRRCKLHSGDTQRGFRGSRPSRDDHERCLWMSPQTWHDFATLFRLTATVHLIGSSSLSSTRAMYGEYDHVSHVRNSVGVGRSFAPLWLAFGTCCHGILHLK